MSNSKYHNSCRWRGCPPHCSIAETTQFLDLRSVAKKISLEKAGLPITGQVMENVQIRPTKMIQLTLRGLRPSYLVMHFDNDLLTEDETKQGAKTLAEYLLTEFNASNSFWQLEILLCCAVSSLDSSILESALSQKYHTIPCCMMSALLLHAIDNLFAEGVQLLLKHGAPPNTYLRAYSDRSNQEAWPLCCQPITRMLSVRHSVRYEDYYRPTSDANRQIAGIVKALIDAGANLMEEAEINSRDAPLMYLSHVALKSSDAAKFLIEAAPPIAFCLPYPLLYRFNTCYSSVATLLEAAILDTAEASFSEIYQAQKVSRLLSSVVLPLLRSGSVFVMDPLSNVPSNHFRLLLRFCSQKKLALNSGNWLDSVVRLLIDARQKSSLKPVKLARLLGRIRSEFPDSSSQFGKLVRAQFPRSLQAIARDAILGSLPVGGKARPMAIDQLQLPISLREYLAFKEHDALIGVKFFETREALLQRLSGGVWS